MEILHKAILVLIPVLISVLRLTSSGKSIFNFKRKRRENLALILREIDSLKLDSEYKNTIEEEYKRILLEEIKGFGITPYNNKIIMESGILDHYTNSHIKLAYPFFDYSNSKLSIKINWFEKFKA